MTKKRNLELKVSRFHGLKCGIFRIESQMSYLASVTTVDA